MIASASDIRPPAPRPCTARKAANSYIEFALPFDLFASRVDALHASLSRATRGLAGFVAFPPGTSSDAIGDDWANWAVAFRSMKKNELYREAAEESRRH